MKLLALLHYNLVVILLPLILSNSLHMLIVKKDWLSRWATPVSASLFGPNKTWRGILVLLITTVFFSLLLSNILNTGLTNKQAAVLGAILGLTYALSELPNSWFKRSLGIAAGARPTRHKLLFALIDKSDSALGVALATSILLYSGYLNQPAWHSAFHPALIILILWLENSFIHILFSGILKLVRVKTSF